MESLWHRDSHRRCCGSKDPLWSHASHRHRGRPVERCPMGSWRRWQSGSSSSRSPHTTASLHPPPCLGSDCPRTAHQLGLGNRRPLDPVIGLGDGSLPRSQQALARRTTRVRRTDGVARTIRIRIEEALRTTAAQLFPASSDTPNRFPATQHGQPPSSSADETFTPRTPSLVPLRFSDRSPPSEFAGPEAPYTRAPTDREVHRCLLTPPAPLEQHLYGSSRVPYPTDSSRSAHLLVGASRFATCQSSANSRATMLEVRPYRHVAERYAASRASDPSSAHRSISPSRRLRIRRSRRLHST